jgi:hypothetical protein
LPSFPNQICGGLAFRTRFHHRHPEPSPHVASELAELVAPKEHFAYILLLIADPWSLPVASPA